MDASTQLPMQQSLSVAHVHSPVLQRLLNATVHPWLTGSAHVFPPSDSKPPSSPPLEPLQFPLQHPLLSEHA
jgi:hypothetical protein